MNIKMLFNFCLCIGGWWVALLYGNALALIALFVVLMTHFALWRDIRDIFVVLGFIFCGFAIECLFMTYGVQDYPSSLPPAWVICIWAMLGTTIRYSLGFLMGKPLQAAIVAMVVAPLVYLNNVYFGPGRWARPVWECLLLISLVWGILAALISGVLVPLMGNDAQREPAVH